MKRYHHKGVVPVPEGAPIFSLSDIGMMVQALAKDEGGLALQATLTRVMITFFETGKIPEIMPIDPQQKP
ncbi:hypothetical protein HYU94_03530 [Candidatus Daviesbacteria bacterium]|nr:hypothetical protein [Candidatus Daviesbacteria bacterium]